MLLTSQKEQSVLLLAPDLFGPPSGIARYLRLVARALCDAGNQLHVVSLVDHGDMVQAFPESQRLTSYSYCAGDKAKFVFSSIKDLWSIRPDLVLVGHPHFSVLGWLISKLTGSPYVVFEYGVDVWYPLKWWRKWPMKKAHKIFSISQFTAQKAFEVNQIPLEKTELLPNCLPLEFDAEFVEKDVDLGPSILTVSRIPEAVGFKGHEYVLKAMPLLLKEFPKLKYHIIGKGKGKSILEEMARELGIEHATRFHGYVSDEELKRHYRSASAFVMPSQREGFGFVFLEAMALGTPAIGGNRDAAPEVIVDGETGYTVQPDSPDEIARLIKKIIGDPEINKIMSRAAYEHAHDTFGYRAFAERLNNSIAQLLRRGNC